jgi:hypothetical protein
MLALCEFLHRTPSELETMTPEDEAFLISAINIREERREERQRQAEEEAEAKRRGCGGEVEEVRCG